MCHITKRQKDFDRNVKRERETRIFSKLFHSEAMMFMLETCSKCF